MAPDFQNWHLKMAPGDFSGSYKSNQIKKFYLKSVHFITIQHKLSRAFQTDILGARAAPDSATYTAFKYMCVDID